MLILVIDIRDAFSAWPKNQLEIDVHSTANVFLRSVDAQTNLTAQNVKNSKQLDENIQNCEGYIDDDFTKNIRQTPASWRAKRSGQIAMMSQIGQPHIFLKLILTFVITGITVNRLGYSDKSIVLFL